MKVLLSLVGKRDPEAPDGSEGAILAIARALQPETVHLLPTRGRDRSNETLGNAARTAERLAALLPDGGVQIHALHLDDPTDYAEIGAVLKGKLTEVLWDLRPEDELHCAISSGTKQLDNALVLLLQEQGGRVQYWDARDPRYVPEGQERVRAVDLAMLSRPAVSARLEQAWRAFDFRGVAWYLRDLAAERPLTRADTVLRWAADLADAYARWDAVDWQGAASALHELVQSAGPLSPVASFRARIAEQAAIAKELAETRNETYAAMLDLYHNARRRQGAGQHVDALARWRRVLEGTLYAAIRTLPGCAIGPKGELMLTDSIREATDSLWASRFPNRPLRADASAGVDELLTVLQSQGKLADEFRKAVGGATEARNRSISAHGMQPVNEQQADAALNQVARLLASLFPAEAAARPVDTYPMSGAALRTTGEHLTAVVRALLY